jgi:hypothetical protein
MFQLLFYVRFVKFLFDKLRKINNCYKTLLRLFCKPLMLQGIHGEKY